MHHLLPEGLDAGDFAKDLRAQARAALDAAGLPDRKTEGWRYTPIATALGDTRWRLSPGEVPPSADLPRVDGAQRLVSVNGRLCRDTSDPIDQPGLSVTPLSAARPAGYGQRATPEGHPFVALNTLGAADGLSVRLAAGQQAALHLIHIAAAAEGEASLHLPRIHLQLGAGAHLRLIEEHLSHGPGQSLGAAVTEAEIGPDAHLEHTELYHQGDAAVHLGRLHVGLARGGQLDHHHLSLGGRLTRSEVFVRFEGPGGEARLSGLYATAGGRHHDHHTVVHHAVPHCTSQQRYKGLVGAEGRGVFTGLVTVGVGAHHSRADQHNPNLLLSPSARVETRPQLVIDNDDVLCSHGATLGQLDEGAVFYLMARGLPRIEAERLLGLAFADEILDALPWPQLGERGRASVRDRLFGGAR